MRRGDTGTRRCDYRSKRDAYPVYAMGDARIVDIQPRVKPEGTEYRLVFTVTCLLEAFCIAFPYAPGDRLAVFAMSAHATVDVASLAAVTNSTPSPG